MPREDLPTYPAGRHRDDKVIGKFKRKGPDKVYKRRICDDDRNYLPVQFTMGGTLTTGDKGPEWEADRNYYIAAIKASVGLHKSGTHPNDGTPSGQAIKVNMKRVVKDGSSEASIIGSDNRLRIDENKHHDSTRDDEDGDYVSSDLAIHKLKYGESIYPVVIQVGSGRPGGPMVVTAMLVPIP